MIVPPRFLVRQVFSRSLLAVLFVGLVTVLGSSALAEDAVPKAKPHARSLELNEQGVAAVQKKQYDDAEQFFRRALGLDPANLTAAHNLAGMYIQNQHPDIAIEILQQYRKEQPHDPEFSAQLGDAWFVKRESAKARSAYLEALKIEPKYPGVAKKIASVCMLERDLECTQSMLERAIGETPKDSQLYSNLSSIYLARNETEKAILAAKRGLQLAPSGEIYAILGDAFAVTKSFKEAKEAFKRAISLGHEKELMQKRIDEIDALEEAQND